MKTKHEHSFKMVETKVPLLGGRKRAVDILREFKCFCGATKTTDILERKML